MIGQRLAWFFAAVIAFTVGSNPPGWHRTIDEGVAAAQKSGKAVLVATAWVNEQ